MCVSVSVSVSVSAHVSVSVSVSAHVSVALSVYDWLSLTRLRPVDARSFRKTPLVKDATLELKVKTVRYFKGLMKVMVERECGGDLDTLKKE